MDRELFDMAVNWLCDYGLNRRATMLEFLEDKDDGDLAGMMIEDLGLDRKDAWSEKSWMNENRVQRDDIVAAFRRARAEFDSLFPADGG